MTYEQAIKYLRASESRGSPDLGAPVDAIEQCLSEHWKVESDLRASRDAAQHVLVLNNIAPGINGTCQCSQCRLVAQQMAEAGYLFHIRQAYRWWEEKP
jgi:hypothetical protein